MEPFKNACHILEEQSTFTSSLTQTLSSHYSVTYSFMDVFIFSMGDIKANRYHLHSIYHLRTIYMLS